MIQTAALTKGLGLSFKRGANEEAYRRAMQQHRAAQERDRRQKEADAKSEEADFGDLAVSVITIDQAETFRVELETYQVATIDALQANREALDSARERLAETLSQAHVLEDGRRVFETEDGLRVFDEFGNEVSQDVVTPEEISDLNPKWEHFQGNRAAVHQLETAQSELLDYQADLDTAVEHLDSGDMTVREYDELRETLRQSAPDAVRARIPGMEVSDGAPPVQDSLNLDAELAAAIQPTTLGLKR